MASAGGSGGGGGGNYATNNSILINGVWYIKFGFDGGSDGSDGEMAVLPRGKGQGTTTRYFGESTGTLYAGGGGSSSPFYEDTTSKIGGKGGAGGGGNGQIKGVQSVTPGSPNTGGGGGGCFTGGNYAAGAGGGYTSTKLGVDVNPGGQISVVVGSGANIGAASGGSGICIIRWGGYKAT